jgi:hypothetical protein
MFVTRKTYDAALHKLECELGATIKVANAQILGCNLMIQRLSRERSQQENTIADLREELSRAYVHDERGRIARHPLNTGGKVKA